MERFHDEWLGLVKPIDGLVVSKPALIDAQVARPDDKTLPERFRAQLTTPDPATARITSLPPFLADILALGPERWVAGDLSLASAERPASPDRTAPPWATPVGLAAAVPAVAADPDLLQPETRVAYIQHLRQLHEDLDRAVLAAYGWSDIPVPPYCPPRPDDRAGQAVVAAFEDTLIDRLFALNAERAAEEAAAAGRPSPGKPPTATKPRAKHAKPASTNQPSLLDEAAEQTLIDAATPVPARADHARYGP